MVKGTIEIRGTNPDYNRYRFYIKNLMSLEYALETAVDSMPLPQANDELNVLTKTSGNALRINVSWVLRDEETSMVVGNSVEDDVFSGSTAAAISDLKETDGSTLKYPNGTVATADEQARFLLEDFQNAGVDFRYAIVIGDTNINKMGAIERISIRKTGQTPITYQASITFIVGDVVAVTGSVE